MTIRFGPLSPRVLLRTRTMAGIAVATVAVTAASLGALPVATSAPDPSCPAAKPVSALVEGEAVHGLTVSKGTTPEPFTGEVVGVVDDLIGLDLDMIIVRLSSPEIDRVGGIWSGMSGSPVYAADGRLIGAVSWGLTWGASPVTGLTPAADMQELLAAAPAGSSQRTADAVEKVAIPRSMRREILASGTAERREVESGMSRLPVPLGISGVIGAKRLKYVADRLPMDDVHVYRAAAATADTAAAVKLVPGGNLAASFSYGDVSMIGTATVTAVCGDQVLGFGHPMLHTGPSTLSMHGASAVYIQEDSLGTPFKVANATLPVGSITQDRLAGVVGKVGPLPLTTAVTSHVEVGQKSRDGRTNITVADSVPDLAALHLLANQDRLFDGFGGGSSAVGWTVTGTRADQSKFSYTRNDRYADKLDISFAPVFELFDQLWQLQNNGVEDIRLTSVRERSTMSRDYKAFTITKVEVRTGGAWVPLRTDRPLSVRAGTTRAFRATLTSAQLPSRTVRLDLPIPIRAAGKFGTLEILGGNSFFSFGGEVGEEGGGASGSSETLDQLLRRLARAPRNDDVLANLTLFRDNGTMLARSVRKPAPAVVNGGVTVEVQGLAAK